MSSLCRMPAAIGIDLWKVCDTGVPVHGEPDQPDRLVARGRGEALCHHKSHTA